MSLGISSIKKEAKAVLNGKWLTSVVSSLVVLFSYLIIQNIAWLFSLVIGDLFANFIVLLLTFLICGPLLFGVFRFFWRQKCDAGDNPIGVFYYFSKSSAYYKAIKLCFALGLRMVISLIVFSLPAIAVFVISCPEVYDFLKMPIPIWTQHLNFIGNFLRFTAGVLTIVSLMRFYLSPFLIVADEQMDVDEAVHMSTVISKATITDFIFLGFSFIFWIALSFLFIPLVFTMPYFIMSYIIHAERSIKVYNEKIKKINEESFPSYVAGA